MNIESQGQIITFYSYKGGTGRTMTLANVACILTENQKSITGKGVLMIDWDLEAPGLHRYFYNRLIGKKNNDSKDNCDSEPGLIDLFYEINDRIDQWKTEQEAKSSENEESVRFDETAIRNLFLDVGIDKYILSTNVSGLSLLKAGRFDSADEYGERINKFSWEALYQKSPHLMRIFAEILAEKYDYVLIDSRTGVTDISGVCTMLLPEKLVIVFTPNMQSRIGAIEVIRRATDYRKESGDLRPLIVFPLVSRVEANEPELRHDWRFGDVEKNITGYQTEFENVLAEAYQRENIKLDRYFDEIQIQHVPRYAYGEQIAVLDEKVEDKFSLRRSYKTFANKLLEPDLPWEIQSEGNLSAEQFESSAPASMTRSNHLIPDKSSISPIPMSLVIGTLTAAVVIAAFLLSWSLFTRNQPGMPTAANTNRDTANTYGVNTQIANNDMNGNTNISTNLNNLSQPKVGDLAYLTTNVQIRVQEDKDSQSLGIHYLGATVKILKIIGYSTDGGYSKWYRVQVLKNGCDQLNPQVCGNERNGMKDKASMIGWMNAKFISRDRTNSNSIADGPQ